MVWIPLAMTASIARCAGPRAICLYCQTRGKSVDIYWINQTDGQFKYARCSILFQVSTWTGPDRTGPDRTQPDRTRPDRTLQDPITRRHPGIMHGPKVDLWIALGSWNLWTILCTLKTSSHSCPSWLVQSWPGEKKGPAEIFFSSFTMQKYCI